MKKGKISIIFCQVYIYKIQILLSTSKVYLKQSPIHLPTYCQWLHLHYIAAFSCCLKELWKLNLILSRKSLWISAACQFLVIFFDLVQITLYLDDNLEDFQFSVFNWGKLTPFKFLFICVQFSSFHYDEICHCSFSFLSWKLNLWFSK